MNLSQRVGGTCMANLKLLPTAPHPVLKNSSTDWHVRSQCLVQGACFGALFCEIACGSSGFWKRHDVDRTCLANTNVPHCLKKRVCPYKLQRVPSIYNHGQTARWLSINGHAKLPEWPRRRLFPGEAKPGVRLACPLNSSRSPVSGLL